MADSPKIRPFFPTAPPPTPASSAPADEVAPAKPPPTELARLEDVGPFGLPKGLSLPELVPTLVRIIKRALDVVFTPVRELGAKVVDVFDGPFSTGESGWALKNAPPTTDVSAKFNELLGAYRAGKSILPPSATSYRYLLVPGMLADHYPGYLSDNARALRAAGLTVSEAPVQTQGRSLQNAEIVRDAILKASEGGKQVVVIGHSKGAVDTTVALSLYPELKSKVRSLVALQPSYGGSVLVSDLLGWDKLAPAVRNTLHTLFGGDNHAFDDVTYASRKKFLAEHPYPTDIPTVSLATRRLSPRSLLLPLEQYIKTRYGWENDGVLTVEDQMIPGSKVVKLDGVDHTGAAMLGLPGLTDYSPGELTIPMVSLALADDEAASG